MRVEQRLIGRRPALVDSARLWHATAHITAGSTLSSDEETPMMSHATTTRVPLCSVLALIALVFLASPAVAVPISYNVDLTTQAQFGNLKQTDVTGCAGDATGQIACGPAAAVNSFVFLQNRFPNIYDQRLTNQGQATAYQNLVATANILAGADFMGCAECDGGTSRQNFFDGKKKYIDSKVPGATVYATAGNPVSASVGIVPFAFLFGELQQAEDVEIVPTYLDADGNRIAGHFLTLTDLHWTDTQPDNVVDRFEGATMSFVDPATGASGNASIFQTAAGGALFSTYGAGATVDGVRVANTRIDYAVAESVPWPATAFLLTVSLAGWLVVRRTGHRE
jgi:hypothetical protein